MRGVLVAALAAFVTLAAGRACAQADLPPEAKAHYDAGMEHYAQKRFAAAIEEFERGHAVAPWPQFLFAEAQAQRLAGDCAAALALYQRFLDTSPSETQVEATKLVMARCREQAPPAPAPLAPPPLPAAPARVESQALPPTTTIVAPALAPAPARERRWLGDATGHALAAGGVLALATSLVLFDQARAAQSEANRAADLDGYGRLADRADLRQGWSLGALAAGLVLSAAAVARYVGVERASAEARPADDGRL